MFAELGALSDADDIDIVARALVGRARPGGLIVTEEPAAADAHPSIVEPLVVAKDRVVLGALTSDDTGLHVALTTFVDGAQTITTRRIDLPGPAEIDRVFGGLGCTLVGRWADWAGTPANDANWHVAVHRTAIGG